MKRIVLFKIGDLQFGALAEDVLDVLEPLPCRALPPEKVPFVGVSTHDGRILPLAELTNILFGRSAPASHPMWLVFRCEGSRKMAIVIDGKATWADMSPEQWFEKNEPKALYPEGSFLGLYKIEGTEPVPVLNFEFLLSQPARDWMQETEILGLEVTPQLVVKELGEEWMGVFHFFPRLVNHLVSVAVASPKSLDKSVLECKQQLAELLPKSLDESVPFVVRYLWNRSLTSTSEGFESVLRDYVSCVRMGSESETWTLQELRQSVCEIMAGA
jgi:chemotaxis signal transduction protein